MSGALVPAASRSVSTPGKSHDVLVLGGGPDALAIAALLGRRGMRGLLVDQGRARPSRLRPESWSYDPARSPSVARVEEALGLQDALRRHAPPLGPGLRLVADDPHGRPARARAELDPEGHRARALGRWSQTPAAEIARQLLELEATAERFSSWLAEVPRTLPRPFLARRRWRNLPPEIAALLEPAEAQWPGRLGTLATSLAPFVLAGAPGPQLGAGAAARLLAAVLSGPRLPGEGQGLVAVLADRAERSGFEHHPGRVVSIEPKRRRFLVNVAGRRQADLVDLVIDASDGLDSLELLPRALVNRKLAHALATTRPVAQRIRFGWRLDASAVPEAMGEVALCLPGQASPRPALVTVHRGPERARIEVEVVLSGGELPAGPASAGHEARLLLRQLVPFFERAQPEAEEPTLTPLRGPDPEEGFGLAGVPVETPVKNLLVGSAGALLPGALGLDAAFHAAWQAAEVAASRLRA